MDWEDVAAELRASVIEVDSMLPQKDVKGIWELIDAGEHGIALENLCTQLYEYDVAVSPGLRDRLKDVGTRLGVESSHWSDLDVAG